jgi:uncharacterized protein YndB with AHSA1/START domain
MTEKLHFETMINAPVAKVWEMMLGAETYKQWTAAFDPSSYYEGSWEKGSQIKFLGDGGSGMLSEIVENVPAKFISIRHLGEIRNGVEDTTSEAVQKWLPAFENYTFEEREGGTWLQIDMEMQSSEESKNMKEMFEGMWPKALLKLKEICEA